MSARGRTLRSPLTNRDGTALTTGRHAEHGAHTVLSSFFRTCTYNTLRSDIGAESPYSIVGNGTGRQERVGQTSTSSESSTSTGVLTLSSSTGIVSGLITTGSARLTDWLRDVRPHPAVSEASVEPHVALLPPARPPGVLDEPEVPAVTVSPIAHHGYRVGTGHVARDEEPEIEFLSL